jgi:hypothetical protein
VTFATTLKLDPNGSIVRDCDEAGSRRQRRVCNSLTHHSGQKYAANSTAFSATRRKLATHITLLAQTSDIPSNLSVGAR